MNLSQTICESEISLLQVSVIFVDNFEGCSSIVAVELLSERADTVIRFRSKLNLINNIRNYPFLTIIICFSRPVQLVKHLSAKYMCKDETSIAAQYYLLLHYPNYIIDCIIQIIQLIVYFYLSMTLDRKAGSAIFIQSPAGGTSIEDIAHNTPEKIFKIHVDLNEGPNIEDLITAATNLGIPEHKSQIVYLFKHVYDCFVERDCDLIEINPLVVTKGGQIVAADSKITIDDNAVFRQAELKSEEDTSQHNYKERIAHSFNLNYIYIGGTIGCLVNGAGLAMATMDIIKHYGGNPANFLDVGGSAEDEQMIEAIKLLNNDPEVDAIFINIFGGILKCDSLANSIIRAAEEISLTKPKYIVEIILENTYNCASSMFMKKPIVLRLKGTNSDKAREMILPRKKELGIYFDDNFDSAARRVVNIAQKERNKD